MTQEVKRVTSVAAIVVASIAFGMIVTADLGWLTPSQAEPVAQAAMQAAGTSGSMSAFPSFADVADRVMPAVVSITTTEIFTEKTRRNANPNPFDFFFPDPRRQQPEQEDEEHQQQSGGSGFIISPDGYILTNNHVIEGASKVQVRYGDRDEIAEAKIIGRDPSTDLALIKITVDKQLPIVKLGDSDTIRVGDWAIAIGNPFQFERTLTVGVISAKNRALGISQATSSFENFIQTDAAINFGNSGGPLLNIQGEVIGINTAIRAAAQNLGFATPINIAKELLPQLKDKGKVTRGYLGVYIRDVTPDQKEAFKLSSIDGAFVHQVDDGPAEKAGVKPGDVVIKVDNVDVKQTRDLIDYVSSKTPGTSVKLVVIREGQKKTLTAKVGERPAVGEPGSDEGSQATPPAREKIGISIQDPSPSATRAFGIPEDAQGVVVTNVKEVSPAADAGLAPGDLISEVNGQKVRTSEQFRVAVDKLKSGDYLRLYVTRYGRGNRSQSFFAVVKMP